MLVLGTAEQSHFIPSFYEIEKGGKSYTIDTLNHFQDLLGKEQEIFFILGLDALAEIESWKDYKKILKGWHLIVLNREDHKLSEVKNRFPEWISKKIEVIADKDEYPTRSPDSGDQKKILFARTETVPISASAIREKARKNESLETLVPAHVEKS
jgi:nicotinate-nucleotide adenylyltransferase